MSDKSPRVASDDANFDAAASAPQPSAQECSTHRRSGYCLFKMIFTFVGLFVVFPFFQNFSELPATVIAGLPLGNFKPRYKEAHAGQPLAENGSTDIRDVAPRRPASFDEPQQVIAVPQSGRDLNSISQDWATRQANLITGGAEQRWLDDVNKKMTRLVKFEEVEGEPWPETGDSSSDGSDGSSTDSASKGRKPASIEGDAESRSRMSPQSVRFTALNRVEVGLTNSTSVGCAFTGNSMLWNVRSPLAKEMDLSLQHDTNGAKSTVNFNYKW